VRAFANALTAESGVRHGRVNVVPVQMESAQQPHVHAHPQT
jgi:CopG family nickel-responsive transcriptional regulator